MVKKYFIILLLFLLPFCIHGRPIKVGVSHFDPPFIVQLDSYHFDGFDISMVRYICKKLKYDCEFIAFQRDQLINAVMQGKVDFAVSDLMITKSRATKVSFSIPYLINITHVIGLKKLDKGKFMLEMLNNQKIGITDESYVPHIKLFKLKNPNILIYSQDDELIDALNKEKISFAVVESYTASYWSINSGNHFKDFGSPFQIESSVGIAINPKEPDLVEEINYGLTQYRNSQQFLDDYNKYLLYF